MVDVSKQNFHFKLETDMRFGAGITRDIGGLLADYGFKKLGLVIDTGVLKGSKEAVNHLVNSLKRSYEVLKVFENKAGEPDYDYLEACKKEFLNLKLDALIGIGGGSTLDLTKGIAVLMTNAGKAITYRGFNLVKNPALPIIATPTTAGTGSEVTPNAVFIDKKEKRKLGINTEYVRPRLAILDPSLTINCPESVTVSSGMDALIHALESYTSRAATPTSRVFSREAFSLIFHGLSHIMDDMSNIELRSELLLGSYYAGIALMNSGAGAAHALSYPLGVHFNVPHGLASAVFLPRVLKLNLEMGCLPYAPLYDVIDNADLTLSEAEKSRRFVKTINSLCRQLSVPTSFKPFGVKPKDIDFLVEDSWKWRKEAIEQNPAPFTKKEVRKIWESLSS